MHLAHRCLDLEQGLAFEHWLQFFEHLATVDTQKHRALARAIGHTQFDAHEKTIKLRFRQREGADLMLRVLSGDDEEWLG